MNVNFHVQANSGFQLMCNFPKDGHNCENILLYSPKFLGIKISWILRNHKFFLKVSSYRSDKLFQLIYMVAMYSMRLAKVQ